MNDYLNEFNNIISKIKIDQKYLLENFIFSIGPLTALIAARFGLKVWLRYEMLIEILVGGVLILRPQCFLSIILNSPIKPHHSFICGLLGSYLISTIIYPFLLRNSQDQGIYYGHFWSRIIASTLLIVDNLFSYSAGIHWNYKLLCLSTSYSVFILLINAYFLLKSRKPSGILKDRVNHVAKLEFYLLLSSGIVMFAFPDQISFLITKSHSLSNESYRSLIRSCGAIIFSISFESFFVSDFIFVNDKKVFMLSRLYGNLIELLVLISGFYYHKLINTNADILAPLILNMAYNILVIYGYLITPSLASETSPAATNRRLKTN